MLFYATAAIRPHGRLLTCLEGIAGLTEEQKMDAFYKLDAAGYATPGLEDNMDTLTSDNLMKMGIGPEAVQAELLKAFALSGRLLTMPYTGVHGAYDEQPAHGGLMP